MSRRRWFWFVLLVCAAGLVVLVRVQGIGEETLRTEAERLLADQLDAKVRLGSLSIRLGADLPWVELTFEDARLHWPDLSLQARRVAAAVDPIALALGRLSMHGLRIQELDVEWKDSSTADESYEGLLAQTREVTGWLRENACFLPDTVVEDAVLAQHLDGERRVWLHEVSLDYDCQRLQDHGEATLRGQLPGIPEGLELEWDSRRSRFQATLSFPPLPLAKIGALLGADPGLEGSLGGHLQLREEDLRALAVEVELSGDALRGGSEGDVPRGAATRPAPTLKANIQLEPDALNIVNAELWDGAEPISLAGRIQGLKALGAYAPEQCVKPRPLPPMPGITGLREWLEDSGDDSQSRAAPTGELALQLDALAHPALRCTLEDLQVQMRWAGSDFEMELARTRVAGLDLQAQLSMESAPNAEEARTLKLDLQLHTPSPGGPAGSPKELPGGIWARGKLTLSANTFGDLQLEGASTRFEARRSTLRLWEIELQLSERDSLRGQLQLAFDETRPRYRGQMDAKGVPADLLWKMFSQETPPLEGDAHTALELRGTLETGQALLANSLGHVSFRVEDGSLRARIPLLLALSAASPTSNPFRDRDRLRIEELDTSGNIARGTLTLEKFNLTSPALTAVSSGRVELVSPYLADIEVALFFLPRTSSLLQNVPLVGNLLLGKNGNLLGAVFSVDGKLSEPSVQLVPGRTFAESLPGALLQGIPRQFLEGVRRVGSRVDDAASRLPGVDR